MKYAPTRTTQSYIALYGAYERDNFGDILFLKVAERLLAPWPIVPLSIISGDMIDEADAVVVSGSAWFEHCPSDFLPSALIVVGGEVLSWSLIDALTSDLDPDERRLFLRGNSTERAFIAKTMAWRSGNLGYVPMLHQLVGNVRHRIPFALNSVGGAKMNRQAALFDEALRALNEADYVSVRDALTLALIKDSKPAPPQIELNPDLVSALPECGFDEIGHAWSKLVREEPRLEHPYIVVQANQAYVKMHGAASVARAISQTASKQNVSVVFQPAGVATGHDSVASLDKVADLVEQELSGSRQVFRQLRRDLWTQVAVLSHSTCFIGTSLHGRIVSASFGRPTVGLKNAKVTTYAETWENPGFQPKDVGLEDLPHAVNLARGAPRELLLEYARKQAIGAKEAFGRLRQKLQITEYEGDPARIQQKLLAQMQRALLGECKRLRSSLLYAQFGPSDEPSAPGSAIKKAYWRGRSLLRTKD